MHPFEMGQKRALARSKSGKVFGHPFGRSNGASRGSLRTCVHARPADRSLADARDARLCGEAGLEHGHAGQRNRLGRFAAREAGETAGGRAPPGDRRGAGLAAGSLGRSVTDLLATLQELEHLGVGFVSLTKALDLTTPVGRAMSGLLAVFAQFEREILRERVRAGLAHARQNGQRLGRPLTAALQADRVRKLYRAGISKSEIARRLNIGRTSVRRMLTSRIEVIEDFQLIDYEANLTADEIRALPCVGPRCVSQ